MGSKDVPIVLGVIALAMFISWIFSMVSTPQVTLGTILDNYSEAYEPGNPITNPSNQSSGSIGKMFGFTIEIPIISPILNFLSWIIGSLIGLIGNVIVLPSYFPAWLSPVFVVGFLGFIIYIYIMLMPGKS